MADRSLHDVVRDVVAKNAPSEGPIFEELFQVSLADPHKAAARSAPGASAAGVEIVAFLTPILVVVLSDATKELLGTGLRAVARRAWRSMTRSSAAAADMTVALADPDRLHVINASLARKLRERGYGQAEIDQISRDLLDAAG
jgi:hypothetical protein